MPIRARNYERLLRKCNRLENGCLEWTGYTRMGYGQCGSGFVHRVVWEYEVGPIEKGLQIDHLCFNKLCCNIAHMEVVTPSENKRRALARKGPNIHCASGLHEWTEENTYIQPSGVRTCRECRRLRLGNKPGKPRGPFEGPTKWTPPPLKTHCRYGHSYSGDNLGIISTTGKRYCKACKSRRTLEFYKKRKEA